jgi:hypothetical protein
MDFYHKYIKYKIKYLKLLKGGSNITPAIFELDEIEKIFKEKFEKNELSNIGQHNCGIIFFKDYAIKCVGLLDSLPTNNIIYKNEEDFNKYELINKELKGLFPLSYTWPSTNNIYHYINVKNKLNEDYYAKCIIMEKLDGDITNYIFKTAYEEIFPNGNHYEDYYNCIPKTGHRGLNFTKFFSVQSFLCIMKNIKPKVKEIVNKLEPQVIELHHNLNNKGWKYIDLKLDNIGYKIIDNKIKLYFIDEESGLNKADYNNKYFETDSFFLDFNWSIIPLYQYSIFGGYSFISSFKDKLFFPNQEETKKKLLFIEKDDILCKLKLMNCKIIKKEYSGEDIYRWIKFQYNNSKDFCVIQKILFKKYRLVRFDEKDRHQSDPEYNNNYEKVDIIFDNLKDVYNKIKEIYN